MERCAEKRRLNTEYVQAVLDSGRPLEDGHVLAFGLAAARHYWVLDTDGKHLEPSVPQAELRACNPRPGSRIPLDDRYADLLAFHRAADDGNPQLELSYRPAGIRRRPVMHPWHVAHLRDMEDREKDRDEGFSR